MDNLSALKLFNSVLKADVTQNTSASSRQTAQTDQGGGLGGFENVFKSYLDRSQDAQDSQPQTSVQTAQQAGQDRPQAAAQNTSNVTQDTSAQNTDPAETPEKVIDSLNVPDDVKDALKKMLSDADTKDAADAFMQQLMAAMQMAGMTVAQVEKTFSDLASSIMNQQVTQIGPDTAPKTQALVLEKVLDKIVAMQTAKDNQQALFQTDGQTSGTARLTIINQQAQTQNQPQAQTSADVKNQPTFAQTMQAAQTDAAPQTAKTDVEESQQTQQPQTAAAQLTVTAPQIKTTAQSTDAGNVIELMAQTQDDTKTDASSDNGNAGGDFLARTPLTEKVITTEIRIDKPQDILKFAELVEIAKNQNASKITVQLHPEDMGKVNIELTEHAGKITGKVTFENENARNMFAAGADSLKQQLADKGVVVENLEFLFKDFNQHQFAGWENKQNNHTGSKSGDGQSAEDEEPQQEETDNSIIYA